MSKFRKFEIVVSSDKHRGWTRLDGPVLISRTKNKQWQIDDTIQRKDGPAFLYGTDRLWVLVFKECTFDVEQWGTDRGVDVDDLGEDEILMLFSELS